MVAAARRLRAQMFTFAARFFCNRLLRYADETNVSDRDIYDRASLDEERLERLGLLVLHIRQDLKAVVFLLGLVVEMLGVIADLVALGVIVLWWRH